ncbi:MAG: GAF domain-containing protein [Ignavibacteriales bacterium]|nr:GAF domain-containing protein [Ignavibacteriales bacterium]
MNSSLSELSQPKTELNLTLQNLLEAVKELMFAHSVVLFWVKDESKQLILETKETNAQSFSSQIRFPLSSDLVSQVALNGKAQVVTNINPSATRDLFCYYDGNELVKSFAGVPVFFSQNSPVAVLVADSLKADDFGNETINSLQKTGEIITSLLRNYTEKYDLQVDAKLLNAVRSVQKDMFNNSSREIIFDSLLREVGKILSWDFLTAITFDKNTNEWKVVSLLNNTIHSYIERGKTIDAQNSIVGKSMQSQRSVFVDSLVERNVVRFYKEESFSKQGSFLCIPLTNGNECFGIITTEYHEQNSYLQKDVETLQPLLSFVTSTLEISDAKETMKEFVHVEKNTNTLRQKFFFQRLENELQRASDFSEHSTLGIISIDKSQKFLERFGESGFAVIRQSVAQVIHSHLRSFDIVGTSELNKEQFFILLVHTNSTDAQLWGEKVRKHIASTLISFDEKTFSVTASIGLYNVTKAMSGEFAFSYAKTALNKANEQGENSVKIL